MFDDVKRDQVSMADSLMGVLITARHSVVLSVKHTDYGKAIGQFLNALLSSMLVIKVAHRERGLMANQQE